MITTLSKRVLVNSIVKALDKSKVTGELDLAIHQLYSIYIYYIEFTEGKEEFNSVNKYLKEMIAELKYKYPDILCNYKLIISSTLQTIEGNSPPTVDDKVIDLNGAFSYNLKVSDFTNNYNDPDGDPYYKVIVYPNEVTVSDNPKLYYLELVNTNESPRSAPNSGGGLIGSVPDNDSDHSSIFNPTLGGNSGIDNIEPRWMPLTAEKEILVRDVINFKYMQNPVGSRHSPVDENIEEVDFGFIFRISDISMHGSLYSGLAQISFINSKYQDNLPPTIGDVTITVDNRAVTTIELEMILGFMGPPYNDPEGDPIESIRIDSISINNKGRLLFDGNEVTEGLIMSRTDIAEGLLVHIGPDSNAITNDTFNFSVRDVGSMTWVQ